MNTTEILNKNLQNEGENKMPINAMTTENLAKTTGFTGGSRVNHKVHVGVDAGNGYFKYYFQNFTDLDMNGNPKTCRGYFESVLDIDGENAIADISGGNIIFINGHRCKVNGGVRIGERDNTQYKQNEYTRANFYFSLLKVYLTAMKSGKGIVNDFYVALGTTTDIYDDPDSREEYRQYMLGNKDYKMYGNKPLDGKITFKYYNEERDDYSTATINIKELIIQPEGTCSLMSLDVKGNNFDFEKRTLILDMGTQTVHSILYNRRTASYNIEPNRDGGYVSLINTVRAELRKKEGVSFSYIDAEVEFKRRNDSNRYKKAINEAINKYIEKIIAEEIIKKAKVEIGIDQIVVTGGTSVAIREDLEKYFEKKYGAKLMFVNEGFFANAKGLLINLNRELKVRKVG